MQLADISEEVPTNALKKYIADLNSAENNSTSHSGSLLA